MIRFYLCIFEDDINYVVVYKCMYKFLEMCDGLSWILLDYFIGIWFRIVMVLYYI